MKTTEYHCVIIWPQSYGVLALADEGGAQLPRIHVPKSMRPARELQKALKASWGLNVFVFEIWTAAPNHTGPWAFAELLTSPMTLRFKEIPIEQLSMPDFSEEECSRAELLLKGPTKSSVAHLGWIHAAIAWIESATGCAFCSSKCIEQWNAGGGFALFRARSDDDQHYWLKATSGPNSHEFAMTCFLCRLCPDFFPRLVDTRKEWNAWLMEDAGNCLFSAPGSSEIAYAARRMAQLQLVTIGKVDELLAVGAFDQRLPTLRNHIDTIVAFLIEAMARQDSTNPAPLSRDRLFEIGEMLRNACCRLEAFDIPDTLIHNDLSEGNILWDGAKHVFTDWSEAAIGNAFLSCERLCQLSEPDANDVRNGYKSTWSHMVSREGMDEATVLTPLLAIYAYLYGRGQWFQKSDESRPDFDSYARSLARHMDRAAKEPHLVEILRQ